MQVLNDKISHGVYGIDMAYVNSFKIYELDLGDFEDKIKDDIDLD